MRQVLWLAGLILPVACIAMLLQSCENDLNQVKQISKMQTHTPIDSTMGVDIIYSDSAKVKSEVLTPLMLHHVVALPFYEMPNGVKIIFYDDKLNKKDAAVDPAKHIMATVVADYAITSNNDKLIELRKNVILKNIAGDTFTTEQLFYDINKKLIYGTKQCYLNKVDGTQLQGIGFTSNDSFTELTFGHGQGQIPTAGNMLQ